MIYTILFGITALFMMHTSYAEDKSAQTKQSKDSKSSNSSSVKSESESDDLWDIPPEEDEALVDFGDEENHTRFEWDRLDREQSSNHVYIEHHGYFRFRTDFHVGLDLGTYVSKTSTSAGRGTSQILPPLSARVPGSTLKDVSTLGSANIRFRYKPTIHLGEKMRINSVMDIPDNLVLGSTVDGGPASLYQRPDVPLDSLADSQRPADAEDAFRLRYLWGTWETEVARVDFGRMRHHWGLGIFANGGSCLDCDFGDAVDRWQITSRVFDTYVSVSWDFVSEGPTGYGLTEQILGQPWDWDQEDDVDQFTITLHQMAMSKKDLALKREKLNSHKAVFEWGTYFIFRDQAHAAAYEKDLADAQPITSPEPIDGGWTLYPTQMELFIPDLFLSWTYKPNRKSKYSIKAEGVGTFGSIKTIPLVSFSNLESSVCSDASLSRQQCPESQLYNPQERDIQSWGYAVEFDAKTSNIRWGLHHGGASGDDQSAFFGNGPLDTPNVQDDALNGFRFDRDYIVDLILFREVLGGVHNALYFKPYIGYEVEKRRNNYWGFKSSVMYAMALNKEYTPGNATNLGVELDIELYLYEKDRFRASLAYGLLVPLSGLDLLNEQRTEVERSSELAQTIQLNLGLMF
jgi:uncharacterized protein (TIGR04551 family)